MKSENEVPHKGALPYGHAGYKSETGQGTFGAPEKLRAEVSDASMVAYGVNSYCSPANPHLHPWLLLVEFSKSASARLKLHLYEF